MADWSWNTVGNIFGGKGASGGGFTGKGSFLGGMWQDLTGVTDVRNTYSREQDKAAYQQQLGLDKVGNWAFSGSGPSAAQRLVEMNREQNAANMIGSAKSMPGGNPALANQLASEGIARGNAAATLQGAQIRSAEQQGMLDRYFTNLGQMRQQDMGMYSTMLGAEQQNTAGRQKFVGGLFNGAMGLLGGV